MAICRLTLLDGAARHNVQILITDSGQRTGTGSALMAMKDAGVNIYRWQGGEQRPATIISEPDRNVRYARLAGDFAASVKAGEESVAQVSGVREQAILTQAIRSELKRQGVLGHPEVTMTALSPVWLDSRSRYLRDMYRPGMVMEQWNPETRSHDRYVIDRVPRLEGAWAPEHSVTEFSHSQEAKLAEAQQKAMLKGEAFPDVPMTLYEAIVRDYTG
ncbi:TPA: conjugal transfer protein TraI, partial [Escherichia coli]|nr:conjugal transfer protein TraI [Escherichia coli]